MILSFFQAAPTRQLLIATMLAIALAGCGRRGPLQAPPGGVSDLPANTSVVDEQAQGEQPVTVSPLGQSKTPSTPIRAPNRPFFLDPIL